MEEIVKVDFEWARGNFSELSKLADEAGEVYIEKDGDPKYKLVSIENDSVIELTHEERVDIVARRVLKKYKKAFEELAK